MVPKDKSEDLMVPEHIFNTFQRFFNVLIKEKTCFDSFLSDNNSANDEKQPQILTGDQHPVSNITLEFFI